MRHPIQLGHLSDDNRRRFYLAALEHFQTNDYDGLETTKDGTIYYTGLKPVEMVYFFDGFKAFAITI